MTKILQDSVQIKYVFIDLHTDDDDDDIVDDDDELMMMSTVSPGFSI